MHNKLFISAILALTIQGGRAYCQASWTRTPETFSNNPETERLHRDVEVLCDFASDSKGRLWNGANGRTSHICDRMRESGLQVVNGPSFLQIFDIDGSSGKGCNVIGLLEGSDRTDTNNYIVVGAHYDNIGIIGGKHYPGADSNASGVAAMLEIASSLRKQRNDGQHYDWSVIFVAFDRFLDGRKGSEAFWNAVTEGKLTDPVSRTVITASEIAMMIDIDQVGCTYAPVHRGRKDYVIAIGEASLPEDRNGILERCNTFYGCNLDICRDYYGSERFTKAFYRLGDRRIFIDNGIPVMYFTSGITANTNSISDTAQTLDWDILQKRSTLIFKFIEKLLPADEKTRLSHSGPQESGTAEKADLTSGRRKE